MDFELDDDQQAIMEAVGSLLAQRAGAARAVELGREGKYDGELEAALDEAGFLDVALADETGMLEAVLVTEAVAAAAGVAAVGEASIVAPGLLGERPAGAVAVVHAEAGELVRFAAHARTLLVDRGDTASRVDLSPGTIEGVRTNFMVPVARVDVDSLEGESLGTGSGATLRRYWRLAIAAECAGLMSAALDLTVAYTKERRQFGRAIGSFQALQHRLAYCKVAVEATRWLTYEAAASDADAEKTALAAAYAADAAQQLFVETHQITGAMGYTREHDLHVFSMRLRPLMLALGGASAHARAATGARWLDGAG